MTYVRKFVKGEPFREMTQLDIWVRRGNWTFLRDKAYHPGWVVSQQYRTLSEMIYKFKVCPAILNPEWVDKEAAKVNA